MNQSMLWTLVLVVVVVVAVGVVLTGPQCGEFKGATVCQRTRYIPGIMVGIPGEQVGFETIEFRSVTLDLPQGDAVGTAIEWARTSPHKPNALVKVEARSPGREALLVCVSDGMKNFFDAVLAYLGVRLPPERVLSLNGLYCQIFSAAQGSL